MHRLERKVVIVTGAGQGAAEARLLADLGARVAATDIDAQAVQDVVAELNRSLPGSAIALGHDVSSREDWTRVVDETTAAFGPVTVLVNNAGNHAHIPFDGLTLEQWRGTMNVNARSVFAGIQAVVPVSKAGLRERVAVSR